MSFICDRCNKEFKNSSSYAKHLKRKTLCKKVQKIKKDQKIKNDKNVQIEITEEITEEIVTNEVTNEVIEDNNEDTLIIKELLTHIVNDIVDILLSR